MRVCGWIYAVFDGTIDSGFRCSSTVERVPVKDEVGGSNPPAGAVK